MFFSSVFWRDLAFVWLPGKHTKKQIVVESDSNNNFKVYFLIARIRNKNTYYGHIHDKGLRDRSVLPA